MKLYYLKRYHGIFKYRQHNQTKYGYRFRYYVSHRQKQQSKRGFSSLSQAVSAYQTVRSLSKGDGDSLTVKAWCRHYLHMIEPPVRKISTYVSYKSLLDENVLPAVGDCRLNELKLDRYQTQCLDYLTRKGLSHRTVAETNARFQAVMNYAVKSGYLKVSPVRFATVSHKNVRPQKVIMNDRQLSAFNHELNRQSIITRVLFYTLEDTGMRIGELLGLQFQDVDLDNHVIHINHTRDRLGLRTPKTPHSRREFQITDRLNHLLSKYAIYCTKHFHTEQSSLFMRGRQGNPLMPNLASVLLKKLLIRSGLSQLVGRFTPHQFRHLFASRLIDKGVSPITVSKILGHANPDITLKIYAQSKNGVVPNLEKLVDS